MCYVYFIQKGYGSVKIGVSSCPEKRVKQLQTGNHAKLYLICKIEFNSRKEAEYFESFLHELFKDFSMEGEWFKRRVLREMPKRSEFFPQIFNGGKIKGYLEDDVSPIKLGENMYKSFKSKYKRIRNE